MRKITSAVLLRIAAMIMSVHTIGHLFNFSNWQNPNGKVPNDVIQKMQTHFLIRGRDTTMAASFSGNGYAFFILLTLVSVILWTFSNKKGKESTTILLFTGFAILFLSVNELVFFFPLVVALSLISAILVFISVFKIKQAVKPG